MQTINQSSFKHNAEVLDLSSNHTVQNYVPSQLYLNQISKINHRNDSNKKISENQTKFTACKSVNLCKKYQNSFNK